MSWDLVKIGDVCSLMTGGTPKTTVTEYYDEGSVPWIVSGDIHKSEIFDCDKKITSFAVENSNARYLPRDSVLIALNGQGKTRGTVALLRIEKATCNQSIVSINPNSKAELFSDYLFYYLKSRYRQIRSITGDKDRAGLNMPLIRGIEIPLPPLKEQKRIAAILDKADNLRRKRQQAIQLADEFLRAVFLDMFGDPVSNPKGWEVKRFGDVVDTQLGKMLSKKAKIGQSPKKYLRNANVRWREFEVNDLLEMDFNEKEVLKFKLKYGDLLVCEGGDVGRCAIWKNQVAGCYYQKALHRVRPHERLLTSEYVQEYFYWMSKRGGLSDSVSEVTFSHLTAEKMKELKIPVPPLKLQHRFVALYKTFEETQSKNDFGVKYDGELFSSITKKAFSGGL